MSRLLKWEALLFVFLYESNSIFSHHFTGRPVERVEQKVYLVKEQAKRYACVYHPLYVYCSNVCKFPNARLIAVYCCFPS